MSYSRGSSTNIIVGAAALFVADTTLTPSTLEEFSTEVSFRETLSNDAAYTNVGYTFYYLWAFNLLQRLYKSDIFLFQWFYFQDN